MEAWGVVAEGKLSELLTLLRSGSRFGPGLGALLAGMVAAACVADMEEAAGRLVLALAGVEVTADDSAALRTGECGPVLILLGASVRTKRILTGRRGHSVAYWTCWSSLTRDG